MILKTGREISRANAETIRKAHDHVVRAAKFLIAAHDHLQDNDVDASRKYIIKAHKMHKAALGHLKDLMHKTEEEEEEEDYADEEARRRKEDEEEEGVGSTGLNPYSTAASEYDHMRSGLSVMTPEFYRIEKRVMGADSIAVVGAPVAHTYLIDEKALGETVERSMGRFIKRIAESAATRAINHAKGRVD